MSEIFKSLQQEPTDFDLWWNSIPNLAMLDRREITELLWKQKQQEIDSLRQELAEAQLKLANCGVKEAAQSWDDGVAQLNSGEAVAEVVSGFSSKTALAWCNPPSHGRPPIGTRLYLHPAPVVPEGYAKIPIKLTGAAPGAGAGYAKGWNDCRKAMLKAAQGEK